MVTLKQLLLLERQFLHPHPLCLNEAWRCRFLRWKACQGLKRGLFNLCKGVWALSPIFSRDVENSKAEGKKKTAAWEDEGGKKTRQQQLAAKHWFEPLLIYMFHTETSSDFSEMRQLKERERKKVGVFYGSRWHRTKERFILIKPSPYRLCWISKENQSCVSVNPVVWLTSHYVAGKVEEDCQVKTTPFRWIFY